MSSKISQSPTCSSGSSKPSAMWSSASSGGPRRLLLCEGWSGQGLCGGEMEQPQEMRMPQCHSDLSRLHLP